MKRIKQIYHLTVTSLIVMSVLSSSLFFIHTPKASALVGSQYIAGRIIDDPYFTNRNSMTPEQIQAFLNAQRPTCDTNGTGTTYDSAYGDTVTRSVYGQRRGNAPPFTCLKDYWEVPKMQPGPEQPASNYGGQPIPTTAKSAAILIWEAAQSYNINPQVLLVTLQKEQGLITDDWPFKNQYLKAMGAYCPDTSACDANYAGFSIQMREGARLFRYYLDNMTQPWWPYKKPNQVNNILWNPNGNCGSSNVFIESSATAALYTYTPYRPNQAALDNLYGTGDGCSSYGNRNFWRNYNDWFGTTIGCPQTDPASIYRLHKVTNGDYLLTSNQTEICYATSYYGYVIDGIAFQTIAAGDTDARSLFRLGRSGTHLYTSDPNEVNAAMQFYGYIYEGVAGYVRATPSAGFYPLYRMNKNSRYLLTTSQTERDSFITGGFIYEGTTFYAPSSSSKIPVYRISRNGVHLYTPSAAERDAAVSSNGFSNEGIAFYALSSSTGDSMTTYRMRRGGKYLFTSNYTEKILAAMANYQQETSGFYTYPPNYAGTPPVYRLANPSTGDYLYTANATERDTAAAQYGYVYQGIGFNAAP